MNEHFCWIDLFEWLLNVLLEKYIKKLKQPAEWRWGTETKYEMCHVKKEPLIQEDLGKTLNGKVTLIKRFLYHLHWIIYFWVRFTNIIAEEV